MPDAADMAQQIEGEHLSRALASVAADIPAGVPGECENCGENMPRLVDGLCGFCRDGRIPDRRSPVVDDDEPATPSPTPRLAAPEPAMSKPKTICLPASAATAILAIESRATEREIPLGQATAELIEAGLKAGEPAAPTLALADVHFDALLAEVARRYEQAGNDEDLGAAVERAEQAEARAEAAEARLTQLKALLG